MIALVGLFAVMLVGARQPVATGSPLIGAWKLNLARTHYGVGADPRRLETFVCGLKDGSVHCAIHSVRSDGQMLVGNFTAPLDGRGGAVTGIPEVDQVTLRTVNAYIADATFFNKGKSVLGYRAFRSRDGQSLTIVSVDPTTRVVLTSVVVYDRARTTAPKVPPASSIK